MIKTIDAQDLKKKLDSGQDFTLIEVLLPEKYKEWHIPTAINIPADDIKEQAPKKIEKDREVIVYCLSFDCKASSKAARYLEEIGYSDVTDYEGGKEDWLKKGFPREEKQD